MTTSTRTQRLEIRVTPELKALLVRAAELQGSTLTDFVTYHVRQAAYSTIRDFERLELDANEREVFITALLNPPEPNEYLKSAYRQYRKTKLQ